jgi:hypothetical protein
MILLSALCSIKLPAIVSRLTGTVAVAFLSCLALQFILLLMSYLQTEVPERVTTAVPSTTRSSNKRSTTIALLMALALINIPVAAADCAVTQECTDQPDWITTAGYTCTTGYASTADCEDYGTEVDVNGVLPASSACCICGGGTCVASAPTAAPTAACECTDEPDWINIEGYGCLTGYASTADCETYGEEADANGVLPASACCICGGGTCVAGSSATQVVQEITQSIPG